MGAKPNSTVSADAASREAERLAIATAQARVTQALDALELVAADGELLVDERAELKAAAGSLFSLYWSLERRLRGG